MARAFKVHYNKIANKLTTPITIIGNGKQIENIALWDTGATGSCISNELATSLGLISTGRVIVNTPSGSAIVNTYLVDILLPNKVVVSDVVVCGTQIGRQGFGMLIGMDIINLGDFSVSNFEGKTKFAFRVPSVEEVDFIKKDSKAISALKKTQASKEDIAKKDSI